MVSKLIRSALRRCTRYGARMYPCISSLNCLFQNLDMVSMDCFCGGLGKFSQMISSVEAILCKTQGNNRAGRLFFASGNKNWLGHWLGFGPATTTPTPSTTVGADSAAATNLQAEAAALSANKDTVSAVSTKVAAVTGSSKRRRRRAIANNCAEFTTLLENCEFKSSYLFGYFKS